MGIVERLLNILFNKVDIINYRVNDAGELYLRRWFIWPRKPKDLAMVPRLYLHKFYTGDKDRHLHDHPWPFTSLILKAGYWEHSYNPEWLKWKAFGLIGQAYIDEPPQTVKKWYGPGSVLKRGAAWTHSVELKTDARGIKHAWTLVWTGVKCRSWGFHTENGWCWWRFYEHGACVCYDNPNEALPGKRSPKLEQERATKSTK